MTDDLKHVNNTLRLNTSVKQPAESDAILCAAGFYLDNRTLPVCIPHCKSWLNVTTADIVISAFLMLVIISCTILFVVVGLQRDIMWVNVL